MKEAVKLHMVCISSNYDNFFLRPSLHFTTLHPTSLHLLTLHFFPFVL